MSQSAASAQSAAMPASDAGAEVATAANGVNPEKAKQLTVAVAQQVRSLASGITLLMY